MAIAFKHWQQSGTSSAAAVTGLAPSAASAELVIFSTVISNTGATDRTFSIWLDNDGSGAVAANSLFTDVPITANTTITVPTKFVMNGGTAGRISIKQDVGTDVTFTFAGMDKS